MTFCAGYPGAQQFEMVTVRAISRKIFHCEITAVTSNLTFNLASDGQSRSLPKELKSDYDVKITKHTAFCG